jgi:hypothetical protein
MGAGIELHIDTAITTVATPMTMMRDCWRRRTATSITTLIAAGLTRRHSVQMGNRPERGEALVISVRALDFLAIVDGAGRSDERRGEQTETQQAENRRSASKNLHPLSVAPVLF